ncbi:MAG TPA: enoyl-CoA hydratase/isomerase family protein [Thermoguttaceae bacterium]|nr:enoyl-CoA hydratase/isomerase family protein [Thermoguttaceae bacterium]
MTPLSLSLLHVEQDGEVAVVRVHRPSHLNSVNPAVLHQLQQAIDHAAADPGVRGVLFAGDVKAFVVGAELGFFLRNIEARDFERIIQFTKAGHRLMNTIAACPKPVVACVDGVALGAGTEIALACHRVVASPRASFGLPETGLGIYPGFGGTQRAPRAVGIGLAKWLIFTGKTLSAAEARRIGLVDQVAPHEELTAAARQCIFNFLNANESRPPREPLSPERAAIEHFFAVNRVESLRLGQADPGGNPALARAMKPVAAKGPVALRIAEWLIDEGMRLPLPSALQLEIDRVMDIFTTEDALRGLSFRAGRQVGNPQFTGR